MNPMRKYEGLFIFPPEDAPEAAKEQEKRIEEALHRFGGRSLDHRDWGRRPLGYPLQKLREGRVVLWNFEMEVGQVGEFRKALELDEKILKLTIVKPLEAKPAKDPKKTPAGPRGSKEREAAQEGYHGRHA